MTRSVEDGEVQGPLCTRCRGYGHAWFDCPNDPHPSRVEPKRSHTDGASVAFDTADRPLRGYTVRASYLKDSQNALIEIFKEGATVREFLYPAYRIYNVAAHFEDYVEKLEAEAAEDAAILERAMARFQARLAEVKAGTAKPLPWLAQHLADLERAFESHPTDDLDLTKTTGKQA